MLLTAKRIDAYKAKEIGLVNKVVPHEQLMEEAYALCDKLKVGPHMAQQSIKGILNRKAYADFEFGHMVIPALLTTEDVAEGRRAFFGKRRPEFEGR